MKEMILETKRLLLRELKQDDFNNICKLLQDPIVMYAYEGAFSKKEVQEWLDKGSPDKPGGLSIQLCKSEKKEFYIRYSS